MTDDDDRLIASFFDRHAPGCLPDDGFSERVMRRLPGPGLSGMVVLSRVWTCVCAAAVAAWILCVDGLGLFWQVVTDMFADILSSVVSIDVSGVSLLMVAVSCATLALLALCNMLKADEDLSGWQAG